MNNFQDGKIYKVVNKLNSEIYVGSTTMDLDKRMIKHKCDAKQRPHLSKFYTFMNETGIDNFEIELIEDYPCETKEELRKREGNIIKAMATLNQRVAGRTPAEYNKEYRPKNKDKINKRRNERRKENPEKTKADRKKDGALYRQRHPEKIKEKASERVECECGCSYRRSDKSQHIQSKKHLKALGLFNEEEYKQSKRCNKLQNQYEKQKDKIDKKEMKKYKQNYYQYKKDEIRQEAKQRILCDCGKEVCKGAYTRHLKSTFHQDYLNNINIENVSSTQEETNNTELQKTNEQTNRETIGTGDV